VHKISQDLCRIVDKIDVLVEVDACTGTHVCLASELGLVVSTFNTIVQNHEASERSYIWCGT
jgi:hypothetical protein